MKRRRGLLFLGGLLLVLASAAVLLRRDLDAAWYAHRLGHAKAWQERANAAIELGRLKVRRTANDLVRRLKDPSREVRRNCEWALAEVTGWPWGVREGRAPYWWDRYGRDFLAGKEVPPLPRVELPKARGDGRWLAAEARLAEDRVLRLGPTDDTTTVLVTVRNRTQAAISVLHPPWEAYEAYRYGMDGSKTPVDVRTAPPSSVAIEMSRVGRAPSGPVVQTAVQFEVLPDEVLAGGAVEVPFQVIVSRDRPDVLFEEYRFEARVDDAVLQTPEGLVTEQARAAPLRAWACAPGREALEQMGAAAREVAGSGREIDRVAWGPVAPSAGGTAGRPLPARGWPGLLPTGTVAWSRACSWVRIEGEAPIDGPAVVPQTSNGPAKEEWIFVVKGE